MWVRINFIQIQYSRFKIQAFVSGLTMAEHECNSPAEDEKDITPLNHLGNDIYIKKLQEISRMSRKTRFQDVVKTYRSPGRYVFRTTKHLIKTGISGEETSLGEG